MPNAWFFSELASPEAEIPVWLLSSGQQGSRLPVPCSSGDVLIYRDRCLGFILCFVELKHPNGFPQVISRCWEGCTLLRTLGKSVLCLCLLLRAVCIPWLADGSAPYQFLFLWTGNRDGERKRAASETPMEGKLN